MCFSRNHNFANFNCSLKEYADEINSVDLIWHSNLTVFSGKIYVTSNAIIALELTHCR